MLLLRPRPLQRELFPGPTGDRLALPGQRHLVVGLGAGHGDRNARPGLGAQRQPELDFHLVRRVAQAAQLGDDGLGGRLDFAQRLASKVLRALVMTSPGLAVFTTPAGASTATRIVLPSSGTRPVVSCVPPWCGLFTFLAVDSRPRTGRCPPAAGPTRGSGPRRDVGRSVLRNSAPSGRPSGRLPLATGRRSCVAPVR